MELTEGFANTDIGFERRLSEYSSNDGWLLTYRLINATNSIQIIAATAPGDPTLWQVDEAAATTAGWAAGDYTLIGTVSLGGQTTVVYQGDFKLWPDLAAPVDLRTQVKRTLDNINAFLEGNTTRAVQEYSVDGHAIKRYTVEELLVLQSRYQALYQRELDAKNLDGGASGARVGVRFTRPR